MEVHLIIDSNYLLNRILHIKNYQELSYEGDPSGGVFGFLKSLYFSSREIAPDKVICVWDGSRSSRRMTMFPEYKKKDKPNKGEEVIEGYAFSDLLNDQKRKLLDLLPKLGIHTFYLQHKEADDVICRLIKNHKKDNVKYVLLTDDKDYLQLVNEDVIIKRPIGGQKITLSNFQENLFSITKLENIKTPNHYLLYHSIMGDSSDNISKVKGVGRTTLDAIFSNTEVTGNISEDMFTLVTMASKSKSAKIAKLAKPESVQIILRNYNLVNMSLEEFTPEEDMIISDVCNEFLVQPNDIVKSVLLNNYGITSLI